jgi:hypothetical protein
VNKPEVDVDGELYEDDFDWDPRWLIIFANTFICGQFFRTK